MGICDCIDSKHLDLGWYKHLKKDDDNILTKRVDVLIPEVIQVLIYNYSDFRVNYAFITFFVDIKHIAFPN